MRLLSLIRMEVVQKVRKHKEETGVAISTFIEKAILDALTRKSIFDCLHREPPTPEEIEAYAKAVKTNKP